MKCLLLILLFFFFFHVLSYGEIPQEGFYFLLYHYKNLREIVEDDWYVLSFFVYTSVSFCSYLTLLSFLEKLGYRYKNFEVCLDKYLDSPFKLVQFVS